MLPIIVNLLAVFVYVIVLYQLLGSIRNQQMHPAILILTGITAAICSSWAVILKMRMLMPPLVGSSIIFIMITSVVLLRPKK